MKFLNKSNPGAEHLETYHFERDLAEVVALQEPVGGGNGEQVVENEQVVANEQVEEAGVNNEEDKEARKRELEQKQDDEVRALLTPGVIVTMHRDATWEEEPVLQLMAKKMVNGKLVSVTMSDGSHVSANIEPSEETMAKALKAVEQYDLVKIRSASVQKSKMILHDIEHLELSDENDAHIPIHGAVKAVGVESLRIIKQEALDLWGVRFETRRKIEMPAKEDDLEESLLSQDTVFEQVGRKRGQDQVEGECSSRPKRQLVSCPFCVRTFPDQEKLKGHLKVHVDM